MKKLIKPLLLACIMMTCYIAESYASHAAGMEIRYRHLSGDRYSVTLTFFRDASGIPAPPTFAVTIRSQSLGIPATPISSPTPGQSSPIRRIAGPIIDNGLVNCISPAVRSQYRYEEYIYRGEFDFSDMGFGGMQADDWVIAASECCRPFTDNTNGGLLYSECGLNNKDFPHGNSSAFWHSNAPDFPGKLTDTVINYLVRTVCADNFYTFDQSVVEYDPGDSISYELIAPLVGFNTPSTYKGGYSSVSPFPFYTPPGLAIGLNGVINVTPSPPPGGEDTYVLGIKATEWHKDTVSSGGIITTKMVERGYVIRDYTLIVVAGSNCFRDSVHLANPTPQCGDSILNMRFFVGTSPTVATQVKCESISKDGTEFRVGDFTDPANVRYIGVLESNWRCRSGNVGLIQVSLAEPLYYGRDYRVFLKNGTDLNALESECGFVEPEFSGTPITVGGITPVDLGLPPAIAICLPQENPFPLLQDTFNFAEQYHWKFDGDTVKDHEISSFYADAAGTYEVLVRGPYDCPGSDRVDVYFPPSPDFVFDFPPYCDEFTDNDTTNHIMDSLFAPPPPTPVGSWQWEYDFGPPNGFSVISTDADIATVGMGQYRLSYIDDPVAPGVAGCVTTKTYDLNRQDVRPDAGLNVDIFGDPIICAEGSDDVTFWINEDLLKPNFKAKPGYGPNTPYRYQWFSAGGVIIGANDSTFASRALGKYFVLVEDDYGCFGIDSLEIQQIAPTGPFEVFCEVISGKKGRFYWYDIPFANSYLISLDKGVTWSPVQGTSFEVDDIKTIGSVKVKAVLNNACKESAISDSYPCAAEIFPPNIFTPNKDGLNDVFFIGSLDLFPGSTVKIFDRWGTTVYESSDYKNDWDGGDTPEGTYYYVINVNDPVKSVYKGVITLLR